MLFAWLGTDSDGPDRTGRRGEWTGRSKAVDPGSSVSTVGGFHLVANGVSAILGWQTPQSSWLEPMPFAPCAPASLFLVRPVSPRL